MTVLNHTTGILADGWAELLGVIVVFGLYAVSAIVKKLGGNADEKEASKTSYTIELAKKRAMERQAAQQQVRLEKARKQAAKNYGPQSEWDRMQGDKRLKLQQMRQRMKQPTAQMIPKTVAPPVYKPAARCPEYKTAPEPVKQWPGNILDLGQQALQRIVQPPQPKRMRPRQVYKAMPQSAKQQVSRKIHHEKPEPVIMQPIGDSTLETMLRHPSELRSAIILKEILDKPVALREDWGFDI